MFILTKTSEHLLGVRLFPGTRDSETNWSCFLPLKNFASALSRVLQSLTCDPVVGWHGCVKMVVFGSSFLVVNSKKNFDRFFFLSEK